MANFKKALFEDTSSFTEEQAAKIGQGQYPIILAKEGKFEFLYISESDFELYSHFDATDEDAAAQHEQHGIAVPIVYDGFDTGGIANKVLEAPSEETPA